MLYDLNEKSVSNRLAIRFNLQTTPGTFRTEMFLSSWAEHTRQLARTTKGEREIVQRALGMHVGDEGPAVRHYLKADRMSTAKDSQCGLVPAPREGLALRSFHYSYDAYRRSRTAQR